MSLTIGLDFDKTITEDTRCFVELVKLFQKHGHKVIIVTARNKEEVARSDITQFLRRLNKPPEVIYTSRQGKEKFCKDMGIDIDIWIDDFPQLICFDIKEAVEHRGYITKGFEHEHENK